MLRMEPATAVANSQRKNSAPRSYGSPSLTSAAGGRSGRRLARGGNETLAVLPRRLCDELLGPQAEAAGGVLDADLVAPHLPAVSERRPSWSSCPARRGTPRPSHAHACGCARRRRRSAPRPRGRKPTGRIAAADRRLAVENRVECTLLRERLEIRTGIGDDRELLGVLSGQLPEVLEVRARLERRPRLGRRDEEGPADVDRVLQPADRLRVRRIENVKVLRAEAASEDRARGSSPMPSRT